MPPCLEWIEKWPTKSKHTVTPQLRIGVRGSLPFFPFFHFQTFFHIFPFFLFFHFFIFSFWEKTSVSFVVSSFFSLFFSLFFLFFFLMFFSFSPSSRAPPENIGFSFKNPPNLKTRFWVREEERKKGRQKEERRTRRQKQVPFHNRTRRTFWLFACVENPSSKHMFEFLLSLTHQRR